MINSTFLSYQEIKGLLKPLGLQSLKEYKKKRQEDPFLRSVCPAKPSQHYKDEFISAQDFLSISRTRKSEMPVMYRNTIYKPYQVVLDFIASNNITTRKQWEGIKKPSSIPPNLNIYKGYGFRSYANLFGAIKARRTRFASYERACEIVRGQAIKNARMYAESIKNGALPSVLPASPHIVYKGHGWNGWSEFLAKNKIAFPSWQELKEIVQQNDIRSFKQYINFKESKQHTLALPASPSHTYKEFTTYQELFGKSSPFSSIRHKKAIKLLKELEDKLGSSLSLFSHTEIISILKNFPEGRAILLANYSLEKIISLVNKSINGSWKFTDLGGYGQRGYYEGLLSIEKYTAQEHSELELNFSILVDLIVRKSINDPHLLAVIKSIKNPNELVLKLRETISSIENLPEFSKKQYQQLGIRKLNIGQRFFAKQALTKRLIGNWSSPGTGKTIAALYTLWLAKKKNVLILSGKATFAQWSQAIKSVYQNKVIVNINQFEDYQQVRTVQFNIINYEKLTTFNRHTRINNLFTHQYDAIILDESHLMKKTADTISFKRQSFIKLVDHYRDNSKFFFLMLSATPFINTLEEALSCLQLLNPKINLPTYAKAEILYEYHNAFMQAGIRTHSSTNMDIELDEIKIILPAERYKRLTMSATSILDLERLLAEIKIKSCIDSIKPGDIIYTHYVTGIVEVVTKALKEKNYSIAIHTGEEKAGLNSFIKGEKDILICSRALLYGFDGLQKRGNTIMVLSAMWTYTEYEQLMGRIKREGSQFTKIKIRVPMVEAINQKATSWDQLRWDRIKSKRSLLESVLDGNFPDTWEIDKEKLYKEFKESLQVNQQDD